MKQFFSIKNPIFGFGVYVHKNMYVITELVKRHVYSRYRSSYLGISWAFIEPLSLMLILNFIFGTGLKGGASVGVPFIAYLVCGLAPFTFFNEGLTMSTMSIRKNAYLLRKVNFRATLIPFTQILANLFIHVLVLIAVILILFWQKIYPTWMWLEVLYYTFSLTIMLFGAGLLLSSIAVFVLDLNSIVGIATRFLFYLTPVFWAIDSFPKEYHWVLKANPLFYIITGYRDAFFGLRHFWDVGYTGIYFWFIAITLNILGYIVFKKLRPYFSDVL